MAELTLALAFMAGLLGSAHCIGMCGGLVGACFLQLGSAAGPGSHLAYHGSRIAVYSLAGAAAGALGLLIAAGSLGLVQGGLMVLAGGIVILLGLDLLGWHWIPWTAVTHGFTRWLGPVLGNARRRSPMVAAGSLGLLNGMLPCPLTLAMAIQAMTLGSAASGATLMLAFGLGTLPAMLTVGFLVSRFGWKARHRLVQIAGLILIFLGGATVYQGFSFLLVMRSLAGTLMPVA